MAEEIPVRSGWRRHAVATRTSGGHVYLLLAIRKNMCDRCRYGVRVHTTWGAPTGDVNLITWCSSCFNADCTRGALDAAVRPRWRRMIDRAGAEAHNSYHAARPAIEDLERRGLV
jgi:hypothetical protein